jgi:hypothetical protein
MSKSSVVLTTVNAPYGTSLTAEELAAILGELASADRCDPSAFAFFSEVDESLQRAFIAEMGVDLATSLELARRFSAMAGYDLPLAPSDGGDDYGSIPFDEWKGMIRKDVEERFGPIPSDLVPVGEAGW